MRFGIRALVSSRRIFQVCSSRSLLTMVDITCAKYFFERLIFICEPLWTLPAPSRYFFKCFWWFRPLFQYRLYAIKSEMTPEMKSVAMISALVTIILCWILLWLMNKVRPMSFYSRNKKISLALFHSSSKSFHPSYSMIFIPWYNRKYTKCPKSMTKMSTPE